MTAHAKNTFQDKGLVLVLQDLHAASPGQLRSKSSDEAARDYCWSALVLSSALAFGSLQAIPIRCIWLTGSGSCH